jgi:organic hydroperoxide reductase OsmC/OhrA
MSQHVAEILWERQSKGFSYEEYNRGHLWRFDGGTVNASASPEYRGDKDRVDPEEALVAAISSCHMLSFLAIAARKRLTVDSYKDRAVGKMEKIPNGQLAVTRVDLFPRVTFATEVDARTVEQMHHLAHEQCFIANSVRTEIVVNS